MQKCTPRPRILTGRSCVTPHVRTVAERSRAGAQLGTQRRDAGPSPASEEQGRAGLGTAAAEAFLAQLSRISEALRDP